MGPFLDALMGELSEREAQRSVPDLAAQELRYSRKQPYCPRSLNSYMLSAVDKMQSSSLVRWHNMA